MVERDLPFGARASMEPAFVELRYQPIEGGDVADVELPLKTSWEDASIFFEASFDGEVIHVSVIPKTPIRIESVNVVLRHAFTSDEMVLLNGLRSLADASEHPAWAHAHFLKNMANKLVRRQLLGGTNGAWLGDAAVFEEDIEKGASGVHLERKHRIVSRHKSSSTHHGDLSHSVHNYKAGLFRATRAGEGHGFTYATFRRGEGMILVGSLDESRGFTRIDAHPAQGAVTLATECPEETLHDGIRVSLGRYAVVRGTRRQCYDRWFELSEITVRPAKLLLGYTSRYLQGDAVDSAKLFADIGSMSAFFESLPELIDGGVEKAFLVESSYCPVGDWLDYDKRRFPEGLAPVAQVARAAGFVPGIFIAPFVCHRDSLVFEKYPEWLLRDETGDPVFVGSSRDGVYALDTLNVDVRSYVLEALQVMTREWGFRIIVAGCLFAACMRAHGGRNRGELMADAIDLVRLGVGEDVAILACDVPSASAFGKVEYCRVSGEEGSHWPGESKARMFGPAPARKTASLVGIAGLLDGRAFGIDVDVLFDAGAAGAQGAQVMKALAATDSCGSVFLACDDMDSWDEDVRKRYIDAIVTMRG